MCLFAHLYNGQLFHFVRAQSRIFYINSFMHAISSCEQDLVNLSHWGGFLLYPYSSLSAASPPYLLPPVQPTMDFRAYSSFHSQDYFTSPLIRSSFLPVGGGRLKCLNTDLLMFPRREQKNSVDKGEADWGQHEPQTG